MNITEFLKQAVPASLTAQVTEAFKLWVQLPKVTWPTVPTTGDLFEHVR